MTKSEKRAAGDDMRMSDAIWERTESLLPLEEMGSKGGRPRKAVRDCMDGILFYVLPTGCQWKSMPRMYGAPGTVHGRYHCLSLSIVYILLIIRVERTIG